ncbi:nose resistant to fluoxetine protein 6-like [Atheta coriaria]|uniref:nose resistant to fluoxetine protein 6-like n=1 Tax=Dalotia coriaria TaxID=877792 RepID=UPI0031F455A9
MILRELILNISIVLLCVLSVSSEITMNNTKTYIEVINSLSNYPETFLGGFKDADISLNCKKALRYYKTGLVNQEEWAIQMLDAMSKLQSGILEGNLYNLGAYDECQSIRDVKVHIQPKDKNIGESMTLINGKYCLGSIQLGRLGFYWAMCAPDACSADDLNKIIQVIKVPIVFTEDRCHDPSQDPEITDGDIAVITCFGIILAIMATSSVYDVFLRYFEKKTVHPLLLAFSVVTNGEKLFATKEPGTAGDQLECLSGIRSFSMMWVVLGHIFSNTSTIGATNMIKLLEFMTDGWTMYIRGATVAVDSFFLMGGVVMIYVYLKSTKNKQTFNVFLYYLHRYLRLTPALAAVLAVHLTILKHFGSGPFWNFIEAYGVVNCRKYWYGVLFYIQNYTNAYEMCIGHTWYLSVDTQLFVLSPLILFPIKRWPKLTLAAVLILTLASISSSFALAWVYELIDGNSLTATPQQTEDHSRLYYTATYSRAAPG